MRARSELLAHAGLVLEGRKLLDQPAGQCVASAAAAPEQGAQGARDQDLLAVVSSCHPQTLRTVRWATTKLKDASPQILDG